MNCLSIERIWEDNDFFEIEVIAQSMYVCAKTTNYTTVEAINELSLLLNTFTNNFDDRCFWRSGEKGDGTTPYISFEFIRKDKCGHIDIEIYMEINDGASYDKHHCCFFIQTELGMLNEFGKSLFILNQSGVGKRVFLSAIDN